MHVTKVHGCGNDFVVIADLDDLIDVGPGLVRALCDRHRGIGGDGVIRLAPPRDDGSDVFMDYRNADGGIVEMCGNGVRCVATYLLNRDPRACDVVRVGSRAGVRDVVVTGRDEAGRVVETRVDMGAPVATGDVLLRVPTPDGNDVTTVRATTVSVGNPHAVVEVDDVDKAPVADWGRRIERDPMFEHGTNVEFITVPDTDVVRGRIWERGVGETLASGTGASAMAVAAHLLGRTGRRVRVEVPGGVLFADWTSDTLHIRGPAVEVFDADLDDEWLRAVDHE
ncbi:MAG TPA: diaminopimelate epimerase [Euzebyales bacterium]|nr:diaminopimelate epimerase [Euzebyales bacterium]